MNLVALNTLAPLSRLSQLGAMLQRLKPSWSAKPPSTADALAREANKLRVPAAAR
jgi:hypothetical protein